MTEIDFSITMSAPSNRSSASTSYPKDRSCAGALPIALLPLLITSTMVWRRTSTTGDWQSLVRVFDHSTTRVKTAVALSSLPSVWGWNRRIRSGRVRIVGNVSTSKTSFRASYCCLRHEPFIRRARLDETSLSRRWLEMSANKALLLGTNFRGYPLAPNRARTSSTVEALLSSVTQSTLPDEGQIPSLYTIMPTTITTGTSKFDF